MKTIKHQTNTSILLVLLLVGSFFTASAQNGWEKLTSMDRARGYMSSCVLDSMIYVFGGWPATVYSALDSADVFNTKTERWTDLSPMPNGLIEPAAEVLNDTIYVLGGYHYEGAEIWIFQNSVFEYDPVGKNWEEKSGLPDPGAWWTSCVLNDSICLFGGMAVFLPYGTNKARSFVPGTGVWNSMPNMIDNRPFGAPAIVLDNKIYLLGGTFVSDMNGPNGKSEMYDPLTKTWTELSVMPVPVIDHFATVHNDKILVFGGDKIFYTGCTYGICSEGTNDIQEYDPATNSWRLMRPMPFKRAVMAGEKVGKFIYLIGGYQNGGDLDKPLDEVWKFDLDSLDEWCEDVYIPQSPDTFEVGDRFMLTAFVHPSDYAKKAFIWSSDNELVASVSETGTVSCNNPGTATITANLKFGSCYDTYPVVVIDTTPPILYTLTDTVNLKTETSVQVSSNEKGIVYMTPLNTDNVISEIEVEADTPTDLVFNNPELGKYKLYAMDESLNISKPDTLEIINTTGIIQQFSGNIIIRPNPARNTLTIETAISGHYTIDITSLNGKLILNQEIDGTSAQVNLSSFREGVYFITIRSKDSVIIRKVIKL